jgi:hypothetical protein
VLWVHEETWPHLRFLLGVVITVREETVTRRNFNILTIDMGSLKVNINPLNAELNPICLLLALLGAHHILHISRIRVN